MNRSLLGNGSRFKSCLILLALVSSLCNTEAQKQSATNSPAGQEGLMTRLRFLELTALQSPDPAQILAVPRIRQSFRSGAGGEIELPGPTISREAPEQAQRPWNWSSLRLRVLTAAGPRAGNNSPNPRLDPQSHPADGPTGVPISTWAHAGVRFTNRALAWPMGAGETPDKSTNGSTPLALVTRLDFTNTTSEARQVLIWFQWDKHPDRIRLGVDGTMVLLKPSDGTPREGYLATRGIIHTFSRGELDPAVLEGTGDDSGRFTEAIRYSVELPPTGGHAIEWTVPYLELFDSSQLQQLKRLRYSDTREQSDRWWSNRMKDGIQVEGGNPAVRNLFENSTRQILTSIQVNPLNGLTCLENRRTGARPSAQEYLGLVRALEMLGQPAAARELIESRLFSPSPASNKDSQPSDPDHQPGPEELAAVLTAAAEHTRWTRDGSWIATAARPILLGCEVLMTNSILAGVTVTNSPVNSESLALLGMAGEAMRHCADALQLAGHPEAARIAGFRERIGTKLRALVEQRMDSLSRGGAWVAGSNRWDLLQSILSPGETGSETGASGLLKLTHNPGLLAEGVFPLNHPFRGLVVTNWISLSTASWTGRMPLWLPRTELLRTGVQGLDRIWASNTSTNISPDLPTLGGVVQLVRGCLASEYEESLWILPGATSDWLGGDSPLRIRNLPTYFGRLMLTTRLSARQDQLEIQVVLEETQNQRPNAVFVKNLTPAGKRLKKILCNERTLKLPSPGEPIRLPTGTNEWNLRLELNPG